MNRNGPGRACYDKRRNKYATSIMANHPLDDALMYAALQAVEQYGSQQKAAVALGISRPTLQSRLTVAKVRGMTAAAPKPFEADALPDELPTADELLTRRSQQFKRKATAIEARRLIPIRITCSGPVGIAHMGDPHVDDDGTDIDTLRRHVDVINKTEGLFAGNVGDYSNNWVGRLARLYGEQSLSAAEAWVLVEWLVRARSTGCTWLGEITICGAGPGIRSSGWRSRRASSTRRTGCAWG